MRFILLPDINANQKVKKKDAEGDLRVSKRFGQGTQEKKSHRFWMIQRGGEVVMAHANVQQAPSNR